MALVTQSQVVTLFNQPPYIFRKLDNLPELVEVSLLEDCNWRNSQRLRTQAVEAGDVRLLFNARLLLDDVYETPPHEQHAPHLLRRIRATKASNPPLLVQPSRVHPLLNRDRSGLVFMTSNIEAKTLVGEFDDINFTDIQQIIQSFSVAYSRLNS